MFNPEDRFGSLLYVINVAIQHAITCVSPSSSSSSSSQFDKGDALDLVEFFQALTKKQHSQLWSCVASLTEDTVQGMVKEGGGEEGGEEVGRGGEGGGGAVRPVIMTHVVESQHVNRPI